MKKLVFFYILFSISVLTAQQSEALTSDRPGQALSSNVVGRNVFQIQPGVDFFSNAAYFVPNSYFRYGISDKVELNANFAYTTGGGFSEITGFDFGTRIALNKEHSSLPSALQISVTAPVSKLDFASQIVYTVGVNITKDFAFSGNLGVSFDDNFEATGLFVSNLSYTLSSKLGVFVEGFNSIATNSNFAFDAGLYYLVNNNFQLDFFAGDNDGFFFSLGATLRILPKS